MAGYITRNANILLLFLILIAATALVGATVYFQGRFNTINGEYDSKLAQLQNVTTTLQQYQDTLNSAREELQLKGSRETELTAQYTDVKDNLANVTAARNQLITDKANLQISLADTTNQLTTSQNNLALSKATVTTLNTQITSLNNQIKDLDSHISHLDSQVSCLQTAAGAAGASC
jgi:chromosome segregation ATPase